jgi:aminobenzoyl-glutamate utilization protein B
VGDVSWLTPTSQILTATFPAGAPGHSWQNVAIGKHSVAHKGMIYAAQTLCGAVVDLFENPTLLTEARNEWQQKTNMGYTCPIEDGVSPCIV